MQKIDIKFRDFDLRKEELRYFDLDSYDKNEHNVYGNIMQFTGFIDTSGAEVYEDDLFDVYLDYFKHGQIKKVIGQVVFRNGSYFIRFTDPEVNEIRMGELAHFLSGKKKSVIGNIHQNSELLTN